MGCTKRIEVVSYQLCIKMSKSNLKANIKSKKFRLEFPISPEVAEKYDTLVVWGESRKLLGKIKFSAEWQKR